MGAVDDAFQSLDYLKQKALETLESVARGIEHLETVRKRIDPKRVQALLAKLETPPLGQIADIKTLQSVVLGLEAFGGPNQQQAASGTTSLSFVRPKLQRSSEGS